MLKRERILNEHYNNNDEDARFDSKHNSIEFLTTKKYIQKYLKKGNKILEIGVGTGRYSLFYASRGYDVTAIEYVQHNLDVLKSKITPEMKIDAQLGDAVNLSRFADNTFDITLSFGPLYHLYNNKDINKAISEAVRVTKPGGIIMLAYLTSDSIMATWALGKGHLLDGYLTDFDESFKMINYEEGCFSAFYISEFKEIMSKFNINYLKNIATDGLAHHYKEQIDSLNSKEFNMWFKYHLSTCEREDLQGYSNHMLYICKKLDGNIKRSK